MHGLKYLRLVFLAVAATVVSSPAIVGGQTSGAEEQSNGINLRAMLSSAARRRLEWQLGRSAATTTVNRRIPAAQTTTDSEGSYHLTGLAGGNYQITTFTTNLTPDGSRPLTFNSASLIFSVKQGAFCWQPVKKSRTSTSSSFAAA